MIGLARALSDLARIAGHDELARYAETAATDYARITDRPSRYDLALHEHQAARLLHPLLAPTR